MFRNNVLRHNKYGVIGASTAPGQGTLQAYFPGIVFDGNVIAGGDARAYPAGNQFIGPDAFAAQFADASNGDFHLKGARRSAAREGQASGPGADVDAVNRAVAGVVQGTSSNARVAELERR